MTTLEYDGVEMALADWAIAAATREVSNQAHDHFACDVIAPYDETDPIPYGSQIILRIGRTSADTPNPSTGLPVPGVTSWTGGQTWFVGWRVDEFRAGSPALEKLAFKFAGPWEFFFERLIFQKLWFTWNGTANVADWRSQIILGQSVNALVGAQDTIPGTNATNLMSIRQQVAEIVAYATAMTTTVYGSAQIQSDPLTADDSGNYQLLATPGTNLIISDYIAGVYEVEGQTSATANLETVLRAPLDSVNDITCAEALRRQLKWIGPMGEAVIWFDYTTTLAGAPCPTLHLSTNTALPAITLAAPPSQCAEIKIKRRDDLIPAFVALKFRITGQVESANYTEIINDIAGTYEGEFVEGVGLTGALRTIQSFAGGSPAYVGGSANSAAMQALQNGARGFASVTATADMEGNSSNVAYCTIATLAVNLSSPSGGGAALAFWQTLFPDLAFVSSPAFQSGSTVTVVDDSGNPVDTGTYAYLLTDGQIAAWMLSGNAPGGTAAAAKQCTITATFTGTALSNTSNSVPIAAFLGHVRTARVTLVTIPSGTYKTQTDTPGEVIPYGLAGYIYNLESIPQYEGSFTLQETEITDQCPLGHTLNLSGGLAEWSTMVACIQQINYDLAAGRTTLTFGPASHLGAKDFVERVRVNRGPRWYNLNGNNVTNDPNQQKGTGLGNNVAQRGPSPSQPMNGFQNFPRSLTDANTYQASYTTGIPGVIVDTRASGQPAYGGITANGQPSLILQDGSAGSYGAVIRINTADLAAAGGTPTAYFQPVSLCVDVAGTPTTVIGYFLCYIPAS